MKEETSRKICRAIKALENKIVAVEGNYSSVANIAEEFDNSLNESIQGNGSNIRDYIIALEEHLKWSIGGN